MRSRKPLSRKRGLATEAANPRGAWCLADLGIAAVVGQQRGVGSLSVQVVPALSDQDIFLRRHPTLLCSEENSASVKNAEAT